MLGQSQLRTPHGGGRASCASQRCRFGTNAGAARFTDSPTGQRHAEFALAIHVGDADLLFGGFIDATAIRGTAHTGSGLGTSFGTIPLANTVQGHMNDTQFSSQNSRLTLQATSKVGTADLKGVLELDFLGDGWHQSLSTRRRACWRDAA